jgi:arsenate reductase-like glutaredoxin family protein
LRQLAALAGGAAAIFSWKSPSARPLGLDERTADPEQLFQLMASEPRLVKRPLVVRGAALAAGSDPAGLARLFGP